MFLNVLGNTFDVFHSHKPTVRLINVLLITPAEMKCNNLLLIKKIQIKVVHAQHYRRCYIDNHYTTNYIISIILYSIKTKVIFLPSTSGMFLVCS